MPAVEYDEFGYFQENAEEFGLPYEGPPLVRRESVRVGEGREVSCLLWGSDQPEVVFLHGGAQNAHTWDTVALALARPLLAVDLPGHGHSDRGRDGSHSPVDNAADVALAVRALAPDAKAVVGMSLGGLTAISLAHQAPDLVRCLVLVDITPGVNESKSSQIIEFIRGPESFGNFEEILDRTVKYNPTRSESSLRRGILHNAVERADGSWVWRYERFPASSEAPFRDYKSLWDHLSAFRGPVMLVRGMLPQSVVDDADEAELVRRRPDARIEHVEGAGHSIQGDRPLELAALVSDFLG
jgi:pimeloyl-ACP methyl ester carboxylesterase